MFNKFCRNIVKSYIDPFERRLSWQNSLRLVTYLKPSAPQLVGSCVFKTLGNIFCHQLRKHFSFVPHQITMTFFSALRNYFASIKTGSVCTEISVFMSTCLNMFNINLINNLFILWKELVEITETCKKPRLKPKEEVKFSLKVANEAYV